MNNLNPSIIRNIALVIIINIAVLSYIEFGKTDAERFQIGVEAYKSENYYKAFNVMSSLAEKGNHDAQLLLAKLYENGQGTDVNVELAQHWLEESAKQGNQATIENIEAN